MVQMTRPRTASKVSPRRMQVFGPPGTAYIYRPYGRHWCLNFVCTRASPVLIRALERLEGLDLMAALRSVSDARNLCRGPGNLCQALGLTNKFNGFKASSPPFSLHASEEETIFVAGPRIGISKARDRLWRFGFLTPPM